ncbi:Aldo/keto reductase [Amphibacillus marinus]|uniref:Aldo/keto reductase n=1 Tax=Amphibacillus marinus TaxID=872970 RepID=A0A1H8M4U8_9BACI|nr:aldo/keto reductase [Amphibacillus marinus]SEO12290.1 Aldo/keto reductase [Amphibacillus marinus]
MNLVTLNNGIKMPQLGFGVFKVENEQATQAVATALEVGYRSIDTAMIYRNEEGVGKALRESQIPREELFITTKVWNTDQGYKNTKRAFEESIKRLGLEYVDLYLIHWPTPRFDTYIETYQALEELYYEGRVKAIGVSNFEIAHLERILQECKVKPVVNQIECHPHLTQKKLKAFCAQHDIFVEAWSPLEQGGEVLQDDAITKIGSTHNKTAAQVVLRWHIQNNTIVIPKSITPVRIEENFNIFNFELSDEEMSIIDNLNIDRRKGSDPNEMHVK